MSKTAEDRAEWSMPEWMEPYREFFHNTGGNSVEDLVNNQDSNLFNNAVRAALCVAVKSQVGLLSDLYSAGLLSAPVSR